MKKSKGYKTFENMASLIRTNRRMLNAKNGGLGQLELSRMLGLKNGQYISNIERGLCGLCASSAKKLSIILGIKLEDLADAVAKDAKKSFLEEANRHEVKLS